MLIESIDFGKNLFLLNGGSDCFLYAALNGIAMRVKKEGRDLLIKYFCEGERNDELEEFLNEKGFLEQRYVPELEKDYIPTNVIFSVTSDCNLRCVYCYARAGLDSQRMTKELAKAAIDVILKNAKEKDEKTIHIGFLGGGETMLEYDLVTYIVNYAQLMWDKKISFSMVTNATLLNKERAEYLVSNGFTFTVSLDGPRIIQDAQRPTISGRGSYEACIRGIKNLKNAGCKKIGIRSTLTKKNIYLLKEMIDIAKELEVSLKVEPMTPTGRAEESQDVINAEEFIYEYKKAKEYSAQVGVILKSTYDNDFNPRLNFCSGNGRSFCV